MASTNTKASLDNLFKYKVAKSVNDLKPSVAIIQKMLGELSPAMQQGRKFLWPVALTYENGVTYGDGSAFAYNDDVAGVYGQAEIVSYPIVLKSRVSLSAANAMLQEESTFITEMSLRSGNMKESLTKRLEIECLYGKTGIGAVASQTGSGTTRAIVISEATWAAGIWGGLEGALLECRNTSGTLLNTNADIVIVSVDVDTRTLNVSGNATDLTAAVATSIFYFKGAYTNSFHGIDSQLTNTGTLFNISAATYNLWKANAYAVGGALTMSKVLKGSAKAVGKGGLSEDTVLFVAPITYEGLNSDLAALRMFDSSYSPSKGQSGVEGIDYCGQAGKIKVVSHPFVKEGEAFLMPEKGVKKIGAVDINFGMGGDDYFEKLEGSAGYQLLAQADWCVFVTAPAKCVKFTGITNAA